MTETTTPTPPSDGLPPKRDQAAPWVILSLVLIVAGVALVYARAVPGQFIFDDVLIFKRPFSRMTELNREAVSNVLFNQIIQPRRGLTHLSFALNYRYFGPSPESLRITNIMIHALAAIGVFGLIRTSLMLPGGLGLAAKPATQAAAVAALLFALHPVQTQSVSYIWQRSTSLVATLTVWSMWSFALARTRSLPRNIPFYLFTAMLALLALGTKENAVLLPFLLLLQNYVFFSKRTGRALLNHVLVVGATLGLGALAVALFWFNSDKGLAVFADRYADRDFTLSQRLLTEPRILWMYARLAILPLPTWMNIDHDIVLSTSLLHPPVTAAAVFATLLAIAASLWTLWRWPLVGFGLVWYWAAHVPESTVIPLELMFDHRLYLPLVGVTWLAALAWHRLASRRPRAAWSLAVIVCLLFAAGTYQRNELYRDPEKLWRDAVAKSPQKPRPRVSLANVLLKRDRVAEAIEQLQEALRLDPDNADALISLGSALSAQGQPQQAIACYTKAIAVKPASADAHYNLGLILVEQRNMESAIRHYRQALRIQPQFAEAHNNLAIALAATSQFDQAVEHFQQAIRLQPDNVEALHNLGYVLTRLGQTEQATSVLQRALKLAIAANRPQLATQIQNQLKLTQTPSPVRQ